MTEVSSNMNVKSISGSQPFRGFNDKSLSAVDKTTKAMKVYGTLQDSKDEFVNNYENDSKAYSDALTSNLSDLGSSNTTFKPLADAANSSIGKKITSFIGKFASACSNITGQILKVSDNNNN